MTTDHVCLYLPNRLIQTSQTEGQRYSDTSPFSIPCLYYNFFSPSFILSSCHQLWSQVTPHFGVSLTDDSRGLVNNRNVFIIQATGPGVFSFFLLFKSFCNKLPLQKKKAEYTWPSCFKQLRSVTFDIAIIICFFTKQATLMSRSTVPSLPLRLVFLEKLHIPSKQLGPILKLVVKAWAHSRGAPFF